MSELQRLIFGDILEPEILDKLCNIQDIDEYGVGEDSENNNENSRSRSHTNNRNRNRFSSHPKNRKNQDQSESRGSVDDLDNIKTPTSRSGGLDEDQDRYNDDFEVSDIDEDDKKNLNSQQIDSQSDSQSRFSRTPNTNRQKHRPRVQFTDSIQEELGGDQNRQYKSVDLSVLYQTKNELVYKLTELYLPTTKIKKEKMIEYNKEKMMTQNDMETEALRSQKRKIKEEIKNIKAKLKHQIKYSNPAPLLEDVNYMYTPGMNTRQIDMIRDRNKYSHTPHIARILPQKRHMTQQQIAESQKLLQQQSLEAKQQKNQEEHQHQMKQMSEIEDNLGLTEVIMIQDLEQEITKQQLTVDVEYKKLENRYFQVSQKVVEQELSMADLNSEEKEVIKKYLKHQSSIVVESKYPVMHLSKLEKQCYIFMKYLNQDDFSWNGQKSAIQSDDTGMFIDDLIGGSNNNHTHPIFGITNNNTAEDKLSVHSDNNAFFGVGRGGLADKNNQHANVDPFEASDFQIQEWIIEQKFKQIEQANIMRGGLAKRKKYWGEPVDSTSIQQVNKDNFAYKMFQNKQYNLRYRKDEKIFKIEKVVPAQTNAKGKKGAAEQNAQDQNQQVECNQIKNIKEYEYMKKQESYFYNDNEKKFNINSVIRGIQLELGMITETDFYNQEDLDDQMEMSTHASVSQLTSKSHNQLSKDSAKLSLIQQQQQLQLLQSQKSNSVLTSVQTQQRKEQILNDFVDNFDMHFERRKKELHDVMLRKIQLHEKANQQNTSTGQQQTVAYASGGHALLQVSGMDGNGKSGDGANREKNKYMVSMNKLRDDQDFGGLGMHDHNHNQDEEMLGDEPQQPNKMNHEGMIGDDNMRLRVTKSRANELNHAKCILKLSYTRFDWSEKALLNFHRPNINDVFAYLKQERDMLIQQMNAAAGQKSTSTFVFSQGQLKLQERQDPMSSSTLQQLNIDQQLGLNQFLQMKVKVISNDAVDKRPKKAGIITAHDFFRDRFKLSLKDGKFCVFEHIDQQPLFVNDFGMASKLKRYLYSDKFLPDSAFLKRRENQTTRHMGPHGVQILKKKGEKIPLLGQIDTKFQKGITVMENNMYYCPVFYHKPQRNDFLCVLHMDKNQQNTIVVRELSELYVMGQEEPKLEVYNPQSRQYQHFIKRRTQAYVIRFLQENNDYISFQELNKYFPYINDQILKKIIKEINVEVDRNQYCSLGQEYSDEQFRQLITPENICQYESAEYGEQMLKKVGIRDITNADKISYATNKFCSEEPNQKKQLIARIIEEEVLSTPWNLSQNFIHNKQTRGMMMLEGIGDPSHGCGGYSYLKLPLKISQDSLNKAKINRMYLNPAIQNPKAVTGTDADLRKLSKKEIKNKLIDLGFKEESIAEFTRWQMVAVLRDKSSQAVSQGMEGEMKKFARGVRFTSKKQREMYQKQVNDIFKKQIGYLSKESGDFIQDYSDSETRDQRQKKINDIQQTNNNSRNIVELKEDIKVENIRDIPNFEILLMANQAIGPASSNPAGSLNIGSNSGGVGQIQFGYDPSTGIFDKEAAAQALKQKLSEGTTTLACTILRKKIKPVGSQGYGTTLEQQIERVIFCSDQRQIKGFNKRINKHKIKSQRTKKQSLKEKKQITKPILDDRLARSETSSVMRQNPMNTRDQPISVGGHTGPASTIGAASTHSQGGMGGAPKTTIQIGEPIKISLGAAASQGGILQESSRSQSTDVYMRQTAQQTHSSQIQIQSQHVQQQQQQHSSYSQSSSSIQLQQQSSKLSISLGNLNQIAPSITAPTSTFKPAKNTLKYSQQIKLSDQMYDPYQQDSQKINYGSSESKQITNAQQPAKIAISLNLSDQPFEAPEKIKSKSKDEKKNKLSKQKKIPQPNKFATTTYNDEDFESYKPKTQTSRRRQQSGLALLNELFGNVIDYCIVYDKTKLFHYQVKKKDAPNYYDVIKTPIALMDLKNKAKRQDYHTREQFMEDMALLRGNAEIYNGSVSQIAQLAREIEGHAVQKLDEVSSDIQNFEMLVMEQQNSTIKI